MCEAELSNGTDNYSGNRGNRFQVSEYPNHISKLDRAKRKAIESHSATAKRQRADILDPKIEILSSSDSEATVSQPESEHESASKTKDGGGYTAPGTLSYFLCSLKIPETTVANLDTASNSLDSGIPVEARVPQPEPGHESALQDKDVGGYTAPVPSGELHTGHSCDTCKVQIRGFLYTCVQCEHEHCGACEALCAHDEHLMLRVPRPSPRNDIQSVLRKIREMFSLEPTEPLIKVEVNKEVIERDLQDPMDPGMESSRVPSAPTPRRHEKPSIPERGCDQYCRLSQTTLEINSFLPGLTSDSDRENEQAMLHSDTDLDTQIESIQQKVQENDGTTDQFKVYSHDEVTVQRHILKNADKSIEQNVQENDGMTNQFKVYSHNDVTVQRHIIKNADKSIEQKVQENDGTTDQFKVYSHNDVTVQRHILKNADKCIEQKVQEIDGTTDQFNIYSHKVTVTQNIPKNAENLQNTGTSLTHIITQSVTDNIKIYPTKLTSLPSKETLVYIHGLIMKKPKMCSYNGSDTQPVNQKIALNNETNNEKIDKATDTSNHIGTSQNT